MRVAEQGGRRDGRGARAGRSRRRPPTSGRSWSTPPRSPSWFGADAWLDPVPGGAIVFRHAATGRSVAGSSRRSSPGVLLTWRWQEIRGVGFGRVIGEPSHGLDRARAHRRGHAGAGSSRRRGPATRAPGGGGVTRPRTRSSRRSPTRRGAGSCAPSPSGPGDARRAVGAGAGHPTGRDQAPRGPPRRRSGRRAGPGPRSPLRVHAGGVLRRGGLDGRGRRVGRAPGPVSSARSSGR